MKNRNEYIETLFGISSLTTIEELYEKLNKFVGAFIEPIYSSYGNDDAKRVGIDMKNHVCVCCQCINVRTRPSENYKHSLFNQNCNASLYTNDELFRDLFLWSIFMNMPEMGKIFLLHLQPRICAALIASAIFKRYATGSINLNYKGKFQNQALEFETYAAVFTNKCYEYNQNLACELLLRQILLFGNITCMQVTDLE
ncbi:unnamed protein product [Rotaria sp. Silwood2]|nr:unnamed protein product [Rotaria sp. Silwood2]CAF2743077.1 unnamed protein product [Rotaria sp. Silwood2]CAF3024562.1 unnamed protein product [Rotaria sp. Silwood2]CAF3148751.1 unnamed protein product [Rotaria sp. Silwood2]